MEIHTKVTDLLEHCDRCPANAQMQLFHERDGTDLVFCQHHYQRYSISCLEQGFVVVGVVE